MSLHIEIDGGATAREWRAIAVLSLGMLGHDASAIALAVGLNTGALDPAQLPVAVPVAPAPETPKAPADVADALMAAEERRVAAAVPLPPVPVETGELPAIVHPAGVEVDTKGRPHDLRIYSAEKTKNKDGTWRYKRGTDKALIAAVEAELDRIMAAPAPADDAPVMVDPAAAFGGNAAGGAGSSAVPAPPPTIAPLPGVAAVPMPPSAPPTPEAAPAADGMGEFARMMRVVVEKQKAGVVTADFANGLAVQLGLGSMRDFAKRPDLIPAFEALLP